MISVASKTSVASCSLSFRFPMGSIRVTRTPFPLCLTGFVASMNGRVQRGTTARTA